MLLSADTHTHLCEPSPQISRSNGGFDPNRGSTDVQRIGTPPRPVILQLNLKFESSATGHFVAHVTSHNPLLLADVAPSTTARGDS